MWIKRSHIYNLNIICNIFGPFIASTYSKGFLKKAYTDEPKHYDHLPNMLLVHRVPPNQFWPTKGWTLQDLWRCHVVSGTNTDTDK